MLTKEYKILYIYFLKAPDWIKKALFINSAKLIKERSDSALLNLTQQNSYKRLNQKTFPILKRFPYDLSNSNYHLENEFNSRNKLYSPCNNHNSDSKQATKTSKLVKLLKINFKKMDDERIKIKNIQEIIIEWKEIARRLEYVFLVISFLTIFSAPLVLFGKFFIRDFIKKKTLNTSCGCEHSFV